MSGRYIGGITRNGLLIDDLVDDLHDYGYFDDRFKGVFVRLSQHVTKTGAKVPAIVLFSENQEYVPVYAKVLTGKFDDYINEYGVPTETFSVEKAKFWNELKISDLLELKEDPWRPASQPPEYLGEYYVIRRLNTLWGDEPYDVDVCEYRGKGSGWNTCAAVLEWMPIPELPDRYKTDKTE